MSSSPRPLNPIKRESLFSGSSPRSRARLSKDHSGSPGQIWWCSWCYFRGLATVELQDLAKPLNEVQQWIAGILKCLFFFTGKRRTQSALTKHRFTAWMKKWWGQNISLILIYIASGEMTQCRGVGLLLMVWNTFSGQFMVGERGLTTRYHPFSKMYLKGQLLSCSTLYFF